MEQEISSPVYTPTAEIAPEAPSRPWWKRGMERTLEIVFSLSLLLTLFPVLYIVVALCVKHRSPGPAIVLRPRRRSDGRQFLARRFRLTDEETLLARTPQLINLLRGDMPLRVSIRLDEGQPLAETTGEEPPIGKAPDPYGTDLRPGQDEAPTCTGLSSDSGGTETAPLEDTPETTLNDEHNTNENYVTTL